MRAIKQFVRLFTWFSIRYMLKNPGRALMVLAGVALGAAVYTSVRLSVDSSLNSFNRSMNLISGNADRVLVNPGGRIPESLIAPILELPFIKAASPLLTTYVHAEDHKEIPFLLIGFDPLLDRSFRKWQGASRDNEDRRTNWLELIKTPYTFFAAEPLVKALDIEAGNTIVLNYPGSQATFTLLKPLSSRGLALYEGGNVAITDIATFQEFTGSIGWVDRIDLSFDGFPTKEQLNIIRRLLPIGVEIGSAGELQKTGERMIRAYEINLSVLSFVSLFVGMFLVYSLVSLNAVSRRKELAILRSTGASSKFIFLLFISEGLLLGLGGWVLSVPIASVLLKYVLRAVSQTISTLFVRIAAAQVTLSGGELLLSFAVTLLISILAAFYPAREAMKVSPREAMIIEKSCHTQRNRSQVLAVSGLILILLVWPLSKMPFPGGLPLPGYVAAFVLFLGFSLISPWLLDVVGGSSGMLLRRLGGEPAFLAGRYVTTNVSRTAISVGALITAVALFSALVIMVHSFRQTVELWAYNTVTGDIFVRSKMAGLNRYKNPLPATAVRFFQSLRAPVEIDPYRRIYLADQNCQYQFEALNWDVYLRNGKFFWIKGSRETAEKQIKKGKGVIVSEVFSNRSGLGYKDMFREQIQGVVFEVPILGIVRDYRTQGGVVYYSLKHYQLRTGDTQWGGVRVFIKKEVENPEQVISRLQNQILTCCGDALSVTLGEELRRAILDIFDETFAITTVLLVIALVVAALGITSTLMVLVLERGKEFNTILAIGGDSLQVRAVIIWEAMIMVITGQFAGLVCGFILSWLLIFVVNQQSFGWTFLYAVDIQSLFFSFPLIIMTALAAAIPAIRLVFRKPPAFLLKVN